MHQIVIICPECGTRNVCVADSFPDYRFTCVGAGCEIDCSHYPQWTKTWEGNYEVFSLSGRSKVAIPRNYVPHKNSRKIVVLSIAAILLLILVGSGVGVYTYVNRWESGVTHPQNPNLISSWERDKWVSKRPGYVWIKGTTSDRWESGVRHPDNSILISCEEEGEWKSTEAGYVWIGGSKTEWYAGAVHPEHPNVVSSEDEGNWQPASGYVWVDPDSKDDWRVKRKQMLSHEISQPLPQQNGMDALNSMVTILQGLANLNALVNSWPTDWHRVKVSADRLLQECRKLQRSGFDTQELREIIRYLLELKRKADSELNDGGEIGRATPKYV